MKQLCIALLIFNASALAGCAGGGNAIERAVPQAAFDQAGAPVPSARPAGAQGTSEDLVAATETDPVFSGSGRATSTGAYPNINNEPRGAVPQMTDEQRDTLLAEMQALAQAHAAGNISTAEYQRRVGILRKLAETHSLEMIKQIER